MKRVMTLVVSILLVGTVHMSAQLGAYYKTVLSNYKYDIVESDNSIIHITEKESDIWFYFTDGFCDALAVYKEKATKATIAKALNEDEDMKYDKTMNTWFYYIKGDDGNNYRVKAFPYEDKKKPGRVYLFIHLDGIKDRASK